MLDPEDTAVLKRWFSVGDILTVATVLVGVGISHGSLSARQDAIREDQRVTRAAIEELQRRDITPGAREQAAILRQTDQALQQQITDLRIEMREQRSEILEALARVEAKLDDRR